MTFSLPKLYAITDARLTGLSHAEQVRRLVAGGATLVQLREKQADAQGFYLEALAAIRVARELGARLIINDRVDLALVLGADGVHLGQDDLPPEAARRMLGPDAIIGYSTHNTEQALEAAGLSVDYIAIGPVYATATKENPDPTVGLEGISRARRVIGSLPLVAIGGITEENGPQVIAAGADSIALIGGLLSPPERIEERTRRLLARLGSSDSR